MAGLFSDTRPIIVHGVNAHELRDVLFFGDTGVANLKYSGINHTALAWPNILLEIRARLDHLCHPPVLPREPKCGVLTCALVNRYIDGGDSMGAHADVEPGLGSDPLIVSVSLGAARKFGFKNNISGQKIERELLDGTVVIMLGWNIQQRWKHYLPKCDQAEERWNLSFRFHLSQKKEERIARVRKLVSPQLPLTKVLKALQY